MRGRAKSGPEETSGSRLRRKLSKQDRCSVLAMPMMICVLLASAPAQDVPFSEYQVKAAYLYNFAKFVEWPPASFASASANFQMCILGPDPFGDELRNLTRDKAVNGHPFEVRNVADTLQTKGCQILFVASSEHKHLKQIFDALLGTSVLTVGENEGFAARGGIINFFLQNGRVKFEVNPKAAEQSGLKISSKLLSVAKIVAV